MRTDGVEKLVELPELKSVFANPRTRLSARLWGLDLARGLPRTLSREGVTAASGDMSRIRAFLSREFASLTEEELGATLNDTVADAKRSYLSNDCDLLELRHDARTVGVFIGAPEDWSTYYVRIFAMARDYQQRALSRRFLRECVFDALLKHSVQRVIAETSPANLAMTHMLNELRFHVTGHQLSDRWGPLVRYTKFLDPTCEAAFQQRFAGTAPPRHIDEKEETP
jgi:RimJ/RimL family protein N-acetyltransferase